MTSDGLSPGVELAPHHPDHSSQFHLLIGPLFVHFPSVRTKHFKSMNSLLEPWQLHSQEELAAKLPQEFKVHIEDSKHTNKSLNINMMEANSSWCTLSQMQSYERTVVPNFKPIFKPHTVVYVTTHSMI